MHVNWTQLVLSAAFIVVGTIVAGGTALLAWTGPTQGPPDGNVPAPINVGGTDQNKDGGLGVSALAVFGRAYVHDRLGIGTANPAQALHIQNGNIRLSANYGLVSDQGAQIRTGPNGYTFQVFGGDGSLSGGDSHLFCVNIRTSSGCLDSTGRNLIVNGRGHVGIGTTLPNSPLHISQNWAGGPLATFTQTGNGGASLALVKAREWRITSNTSGGLHIADMRANSVRFRINTDGTIDGAWGRIHGPSDERLKTNIAPIKGALDLVRNLRGTFFNWEADDEGSPRRAGLIAQEVERVIPEVVHTADDKFQTKGVEYEQLIAVLIEAIKELDEKVEHLEARIEILATD